MITMATYLVSWRLISAADCEFSGRLTRGKVEMKMDSCEPIGTRDKKKLLSTSGDGLPSTNAVNVGLTMHMPGWGPICRAPSATISIHCLVTCQASISGLPSSSRVTFTVTKSDSSMPPAASNCCSAAHMTSAAVKWKLASRGGCENTQPTFCTPSS